MNFIAEKIFQTKKKRYRLMASATAGLWLLVLSPMIPLFAGWVAVASNGLDLGSDGIALAQTAVAADEHPVLRVEFKRDPVLSWIPIGTKERTVRSVTLYDPTDTPIELHTIPTETTAGRSHLREYAIQSDSFDVPGRYTVAVEYEADGELETARETFWWGMLVANADQTYYRPDDVVEIGLGAFDELGNVRCDAAISVAFTNPAGKRVWETVVRGENSIHECQLRDRVPIDPDYTVRFEPWDGVGAYGVHVRTTTGTLELEQHLTFTVSDSIPYTIRRHAPTRAIPGEYQTMTLEIHAAEHFFGLREAIPEGAIIVPPVDCRIRPIPGDKPGDEIICDRHFNPATTAEISYQYLALPEDGLSTLVFGPTQLGHNEEAASGTWNVVVRPGKIESQLTGDSTASPTARVITKLNSPIEQIAALPDGTISVGDDYALSEIMATEVGALADEEAIEAVYADREVSVLLEGAVDIIHADSIDYGLDATGSGQSICILDTGVDYTHPAITNYAGGYDFVNHDDDPFDDHGHGTSVAGVIARIAPESRLLVAKVVNAEGIGYESTVLAGLQWCADHDAKIINFSIGAGLYDGFCDINPVAEMVNELVADGRVVVAATGNDSSQSLRSPSCASSALRVGASTDGDDVAAFSNINRTVDLVAPGADVTVPIVGGVTEGRSGTSISAPIVSAGSALVLEQETLAPPDLRYRLRSTGVPTEYTWDEEVEIVYRVDFRNALFNEATNEPLDYVALPFVGSETLFQTLVGEGSACRLTSTCDNGLSCCNDFSGTCITASTSTKGYSCYNCDASANACAACCQPTGATATACVSATFQSLNWTGSLCCGDDANEGNPYEATESSCADGNDNDCDGDIDGADSDCGSGCTLDVTTCTTGSDCSACGAGSLCINGTCRASTACGNPTSYDGYGCSNDATAWNNAAAGTCTTNGCDYTSEVRMDCTDATCTLGTDTAYSTCNTSSGDACDSDAGGNFSQGGLCASGATNSCATSSDVTLDSSTYYWKCDGHGSKRCDDTLTNGDFTQTGMCFDNGGATDGTHFDCETSGYIFYDGTYYEDDANLATTDYDADLDSNGKSCDNSLTSGDYSANGMVTTSGCDSSGVVRIDASNNNYFVSNCDNSIDWCDTAITGSSLTAPYTTNGLCASNNCSASGAICLNGGSYYSVFGSCSNNDQCDSNIVLPSLGWTRDGYVCSSSCYVDGSRGNGESCCTNANCASGNCSAGTCAGVGITISGTAYQTNETSAITSSGASVKAVNAATGTTASDADGTDGSGNWTISLGETPTDGSVIVIWINDNATYDGTLVLEYGSSCTGYPNCTGLSLYQDRVILRSEHTGNILTNAEMAGCDADSGTNCGDTEINFTSNSNAINVTSNIELHVWTGDTYDPGGTVTTNGTGNFHVDDSATASLDTASNSIGGDILVDGGATLHIDTTTMVNGGAITTSGTGATVDYSTGTPTVTMIGTGAIGGGTTPTLAFYDIQVGHLSAGSTTISSPATVANDISVVVDSTVTIGADVSVGGDLVNSSSGIISYSGTPTVTMSGTGNLGASGASGAVSAYNVTTSGTGTITVQKAATIANNVSIGSGTTLVAPSSAILLVGGNWANAGTFTHNSGTVTFNASDTGNTIDDGGSDWNNVIFDHASGGWSFSNATTLAGDLTVTAGTLSGSVDLTINGGDLTGDGTVTMSGGTVYFGNANGSLGGSGATAWTFYNLTFDYAGTCDAGSAEYTTTGTGDNGITVTNVLATDSCIIDESSKRHSFDAGSKTYTMTGAGDVFSVAASTFTPSSSTFIYTNTTSVTINESYYNLELSPAAPISGAYSITPGIGHNLTISPNVTLHATTATVTMSGTGTLDANGVSLYDLTLNGSDQVVTVASDVTVSRALSISGATRTLSINSGVTVTHSGAIFALAGTVSGDGTLRYPSGAAGPGTGGTISVDVQFDASGGNIANTTFDARTYGGDVEVYSNTNTIRTATMGAGTHNISGNLTVVTGVSQAQSFTFDNSSTNPTVNVTGNLSFTVGGLETPAITSGTGTWTVSGNVTFTGGIYTATTGNTLKMNGTSKTLTSASQALQNFEVSGGSVAAGDAMNVDGTFTVSSGGFTQHVSSDLNVAGNFTLQSGTTFTASTSGTCILDGDLTFTDSRSPQASIGDVQIGASPDTTNLASDLTAKSLTVTSSNFLYTNGYDLNIGLSGITVAGTLDVDDDVETDGTYMKTEGKFDLQSGGTLANSGGTNVGSTLEFNYPSIGLFDVTSDLITAGTGSLHHLIVNDGGASSTLTVEVEDPVAVNGNLTITGGVLDAVSGENNAITLGGNWDNDDTFQARLGTVTMTASNVSGGTMTIDSTGATTASFNDLTLNDAGGNDTFLLESALTVADDLTITGGTLDTKTGENNSITVGGDWANGDTFTPRSGTVLLNTATAAAVSGSTTFNNFQIVPGASTAKTVTFTAGTTQTVSGTWTVTGTTGGVVTLQSSTTSAWTINPTAASVTYVTVSYSTNSGVTFCATYSTDGGNNNGWSISSGATCGITVSGTSNSSGGTVRVAVGGTLESQTTTLAASWSITNVDVTSGEVVVVFVEAADGSETTGVSQYDGSGDMTGLVLNTNTLTIGSGDNQTLTVTELAGYDCDNNENVMFSSNSGTLAVQGCSNSYTDETLSIKASNTLSVGNSQAVTTDNLTNAGGLTSGTAGSFTVSGSWAITGTFTASTSTVTFTAGNAGQTVVPGGSSYYNVVFNGALGGWTIQTNNMTVSNNFTLTAASSFTLQTGRTLTVQGAYSQAVAGANTTWTGSTLYLNGSGGLYDTNTKTHGGDAYATLRIGGSEDIAMWDSSASTVTIDAGGCLLSQDHGGTAGQMNIYGTCSSRSNEYWSYATDWDGTALGGSSRQADVRFADGATLTVDNGDALEVLGQNSSSNRTIVTRQSTGNYGLTINGAINAQFYDFDYLNANGLNIGSTATVTELSDGTFDNNAAGASSSYITLTGVTSDKDFFRNVFDDSGDGTDSNVVYNVNADGSGIAWTFFDWSGNKGGEDYDVDANGATVLWNAELTMAVSEQTISLGVINPYVIGSGSHTITVTTNAANGYTCRGVEDGNLRQGTDDIDDVADGAVTAGSEEYGVGCSGDACQLTGDNALSAVPLLIASYASSVTGQQTTVTYKAGAGTATVGTDYSHVVTITCAGDF